MNFRGFMPAFGAANSVQNALNTQNDYQQQQQAQAALVKILAQIAQQQGGAPASAPGVGAPGGVSPPMGAPPSAGGMPGGAGPSSPMGGMPSPMPTAAPGGAPPGQMPPMSGSSMPPGMDYGRLASAIQGSGLNPGAQGAALQMLLKNLQPSQNNATRVQIATDRNETSRDNTDKRVGAENKRTDTSANTADKNRSSREDIAKLNRELRSTTPTGDKQYDALKEAGKSARAAYNAKPNKENKEALDHAAAALADYAGTKSGGRKAVKPAAAATPAYSQEDLEYTAKQNNMTVDEVKKKLGVN